MELLNICLICIGFFATIGLICALCLLLCVDTEKNQRKDNKEEYDGQTITSEADKMISDLSSSFEKYLSNRVFDRAKVLGRKCADIADFNGVVFELSLDNKLIYKLLEKKGK